MTVVADPAHCSFQLKLTGTEKYTKPCDIAKSALVAHSVNYTNETAAPGAPVVVKVGNETLHRRHAGLREERSTPRSPAHGYPASRRPGADQLRR